MHCAMAQATTHETVLSGCLVNSAAYAVATTTQQAEELESTLCRLHQEANKVNNHDSLMDLQPPAVQHVLLHRFSLLLSNFMQGADHCVIFALITKHVAHALQKLG